MLVMIVVCGGAPLIYLWWKMRRVKVHDEYRGYRVKSALGGRCFIEKNGDFITYAPTVDSVKSQIDALLRSEIS
jgi:hypothetical protein